MAAYEGSFQSVSSIEEKKESKRRAREQLLAQENSGKKKKKDKHNKKAKKEKKKKSKKHKSETKESASDSSTDSEGEWVEAASSDTGSEKKPWKISKESLERKVGPTLERDEWMTLDFTSVKATSTATLRAERQKEKTLERERAEAVTKVTAIQPSNPSPDTRSPPVQILTEDEMNKLGAKIVKAEIMGNTVSIFSSCLKLCYKICTLWTIVISPGIKANKDTDHPTSLTSLYKVPCYILPLYLNFKNNITLAIVTFLILAKDSHRAVLHHISQPSSVLCSETSYYPAEAVAATESSSKEDQEVLLVRTDQSGRAWPINSSGEPVEPKGGRRKRQTFREKTDQDYYTLDDMFVSKAAKKERSGEEDERERQQAISEHRKLAARMEKCPFCFDNAELPKHLIIAIGVKVYLCLPNHLSLTEGHCLIVPLHHYTAATLVDEDIWNEIQMFRKTLVKMFAEKGLDCVFLETNINLKKRFHLVYECIPLPKETGDMAPIYFKKAIMESDEEWSMNKKLIDLSTKNVRRSVPKGLPYFCVDFGLQGGFAHIIEDHNKFPHYFGKEVIGGMLDLEPRVWRKAVRENFDDQRKKVLQFAQWWKPFDFTKANN
ncbi:CWF19-like protein 2 [Pyxicephalus adspersus]|uniref:CWF19-like protein 2 n=1 Tax=Pyxicephalus adspersus TaxID=30357 RepID=UPI003B58E3F5